MGNQLTSITDNCCAGSRSKQDRDILERQESFDGIPKSKMFQAYIDRE